jgi:hypothetical protein
LELDISVTALKVTTMVKINEHLPPSGPGGLEGYIKAQQTLTTCSVLIDSPEPLENRSLTPHHLTVCLYRPLRDFRS